MAMEANGGKCVYSSEWDDAAKQTYYANYGEVPYGDIDDYWIDTYKLQKQVDFLESHPSYSMCTHAAVEFFQAGMGTPIIFPSLSRYIRNSEPI